MRWHTFGVKWCRFSLIWEREFYLDVGLQNGDRIVIGTHDKSDDALAT